LLPIGAYYPDSFRRVHMGPDEAVRAFHDLGADWFVPKHYGTFKLSFEAMEEPARWLREITETQRIGGKVRMLEEGVPERF
jgi:L-ascorbate metabolism protein UlaG (beta-lactamase superfamily)